MTESNRNKLEHAHLDYQITIDKQVPIYFYNKHSTTLAGKNAQKSLRQFEGADEVGEQLPMERFTGNFKHGNERLGKAKR